MNAVLHLAAVTRVHGEGATEVHALRGVTFRAHPGELVAVMGPSGSGKSTLLTLAGGLDAPTSGSVWIEGTDLASLDNAGRARMRRTSVGYVFQDFNLIPALTAAENVALPRELDGEKGRVARRLALAALEEVGIVDLADRFPDEMSGGQQQRVAIARAIVGDRRLILADEPTGALDTDTGEEILRLLRARCDAGAAGVMVTHEARHAAWADRVVFLRDGVVVDETGADEPETLLAEEAGEHPTTFFSSAPLPEQRRGDPHDGLAPGPAHRLARRAAPPRAQRARAGDDQPAGAGRQRRRDHHQDLEVEGAEGAERHLGAAAARIHTEGRGPMLQAADPSSGEWGSRGDVDRDDVPTAGELAAVLGGDAAHACRSPTAGAPPGSATGS